MMKLKTDSKVASLVIHAVDDFIAPPDEIDWLYKDFYLEGLDVSLSPGHHKARISKAGFYYFSNVGPGEYTLRVSAAKFISQSRSVTIIQDIVEETSIRMKPGYDYPFGRLTAFLRGRLADATNNTPLEGIRALALPRNEEAFSDEEGCFMLYFQEPVADSGETINLSFQDMSPSPLYQTATINIDMIPAQQETLGVIKMERV